LANGKVDASVDIAGILAAELLLEASMSSALNAKSLGGIPSMNEI
jgi:hypothetical protein